ncbi:hypothetical protein J7M28_06895, partial [bacterium]|nr:hypothetical protein [bacterium]
RADEFEYDENGNRTEWSSDSAPTTTYTYNEADQLTQSTEGTVGTSYSHDDNGNMVSETTSGVTRTYNYDAFNRMTSVTQGRTTVQSMTYGCPRHTGGLLALRRKWPARTFPSSPQHAEAQPRRIYRERRLSASTTATT